MKKRFLYTLLAFILFAVIFGIYQAQSESAKKDTGMDMQSDAALTASSANVSNGMGDLAANATPTPTSTQSTTNTNKPMSTVTAQKGDTVFVQYTGKLTDGTVFDSSIPRGQPFSFKLGSGMVIAGWEKGILGMHVGEKKTLTIAPADGYGANGVPNGRGGYVIPPNATLVFDVELVDVKR